MKKVILTFLGAFVLLLLFVDYAFAVQGRPDPNAPIKCYQCNSFYDKGCSDFFDNRTYPLIPCNNNATMCRKIIQETYYEGHWDVRYIRQCAIFGEVGPAEGRWCKERSGSYQVRLKICQCNNKDGCNSSPTLSISPGYILLTVLLLFMLTWAGQQCRLLHS